MKLELPLWYDLHTHIRQGALMAPLIRAQLEMGCAGILAMPNTKPPVAKVLKSDPLEYWSIEEYLVQLHAAGADAFKDVIVPLYLTKDTSPQMIEEGARSGMLRACKYYPPHGTTGADFGFPFENFMQNDVFRAMEQHGVVLCIHGEEHHLPGETYFSERSNAEDMFYRERMPKLVQKFPGLKVACEHVTTKTAVEFVKAQGNNVVASITPQHLLYTVGHLLQGLRYHLFCLPLLKFDTDRRALREAVLDPENRKFYAGTDSAPHAAKATECGCAAGCFTGGIAPQLYAQAFEEAGADFENAKACRSFENFLCHNGPAFYGLARPAERFILEKITQSIDFLEFSEGKITPLPLGLGQSTISWSMRNIA